MRSGRALVIALLLAATLVPQANAAIPAASAWSPWTAPQTVNALALAEEGVTIAAALGAFTGTSGCNPVTTIGCNPVNDPVGTRYDLGVLTLEQGFVAANDDNADVTPRGRQAVAVSGDGSAIASLGLDVPTSGSTTVSVPKLYYARAASGNDWTAAGANQTLQITGTAVGVAISHDGNRVVTLMNEGGNLSLRGFTFTGGVLTPSFHVFKPGQPQALAADRTLSRLLVAAVEPAGSTNLTALRWISFDSVVAHAPYYGPEGANFTRVAISDDGLRFAAGSADGTLAFFRGSTADPEMHALGTGIDRLAISGDGARFAVGVNTTLRSYAVGDTLVETYNRTLASAARDMDYNRTGEVLAVAVSDGVYGLGVEGAQLWKLNGDTSAVDINAQATAIAWAQRNLVFAATLARGITLTQSGGVDTAPARTISPGGEGAFALTLRNGGAVPERVSFEAPGDLAATIRFDPPTILVNPEQSVTITATVAPQAQATGGRTFNVTARSATGLTDDTTLSYTIAQVAAVRLFLNVTDVLAVPGQTSDLLLEVVNEGTKSVAASLRVQQNVSPGDDWSVVVEPVTSFTIAPVSKTTLHLKVTPPATAANGTSNTITYFLEGTEVADQVRVVYRINPTLGVDLRVSGAVKYIDSGQSDTFNVTVTNIGSLPRRFELYYDTNETSGKSWRIDVPDEPFLLQPLQNRTMAIRVTVPLDAAPPDRLMFMVTAALVPEGDEAVVKDFVHIYANAQEPRRIEEEDKTDGIPTPVPLAFGAIALAALLLRRRRA